MTAVLTAVRTQLRFHVAIFVLAIEIENSLKHLINRTLFKNNSKTQNQHKTDKELKDNQELKNVP